MKAWPLLASLILVSIYGGRVSGDCDSGFKGLDRLSAPGIVEIDESRWTIVITDDVTVGPDRVALASVIDTWATARVSMEETVSRIKAYNAAGTLNGTLKVIPGKTLDAGLFYTCPSSARPKGCKAAAGRRWRRPIRSR